MNKSYKILKLNITVNSFTGSDRWKSKLARFDDQTGNWRALCCGSVERWIVASEPACFAIKRECVNVDWVLFELRWSFKLISSRTSSLLFLRH